jgi:hypothetical protein
MWTIDQLRLVLPPGFEHRAERIARRVAEELSDLPVPRDLSLKSLSLPDLKVSVNAQDGEIAGRIARAIASGASEARPRQLANPAGGKRP